MKMIVVFSIRDRLKYIGHLDLMRAMQRALRRSGLPVRYSQGFNPHLQISFAAPLSVGMEGLREVMEVPYDGDIKPDDPRRAPRHLGIVRMQRGGHIHRCAGRQPRGAGRA